MACGGERRGEVVLQPKPAWSEASAILIGGRRYQGLWRPSPSRSAPSRRMLHSPVSSKRCRSTTVGRRAGQRPGVEHEVGAAADRVRDVANLPRIRSPAVRARWRTGRHRREGPNVRDRGPAAPTVSQPAPAREGEKAARVGQQERHPAGSQPLDRRTRARTELRQRRQRAPLVEPHHRRRLVGRPALERVQPATASGSPDRTPARRRCPPGRPPLRRPRCKPQSGAGVAPRSPPPHHHALDPGEVTCASPRAPAPRSSAPTAAPPSTDLERHERRARGRGRHEPPAATSSPSGPAKSATSRLVAAAPAQASAVARRRRRAGSRGWHRGRRRAPSSRSPCTKRRRRARARPRSRARPRARPRSRRSREHLEVRPLVLERQRDRAAARPHVHDARAARQLRGRPRRAPRSPAAARARARSTVSSM